MARFVLRIMALSLVFSFSLPPAYSQDAKSPTEGKQAEIAIDSGEYMIGPEDVLYINVWKEESLTRQVQVRADGKISLPLIDEVQTSGLTPLQLKEKLTDLLKKYLDNPTVSVTVVEANSSKVFVTGEVRTPGAFRLRMRTTVLQAIILAGGFTDSADKTKVTIIRKESDQTRRIIVSYNQIVSGKALDSDIYAKSGDTIIVPLAYPQEIKEASSGDQIQADVADDSDQYVIGPEDVLHIHVWREEALTRTVPVRMDGNISLPLAQEVRAAGLTPLQLKEVLTTKLRKFIENPIVSVTVTEANSFKVFVSGEVRTPGVYRLRSETSILQIIPMAGGFTDWANQKKIMIIRKEAGKEKRMRVNYKDVVSGEASNVILQSGDNIIVP
jgi:polysaccharide export outer membrane protein